MYSNERKETSEILQIQSHCIHEFSKWVKETIVELNCLFQSKHETYIRIIEFIFSSNRTESKMISTNIFQILFKR
jgi:hypothetical protein